MKFHSICQRYENVAFFFYMLSSQFFFALGSSVLLFSFGDMFELLLRNAICSMLSIFEMSLVISIVKLLTIEFVPENRMKEAKNKNENKNHCYSVFAFLPLNVSGKKKIYEHYFFVHSNVVC